MDRKLNIISLILCSVTILTLSLAFVIIPDGKISQAENRTLKSNPVFTARKLLSGEYTSELGEYISDQFPARDEFVATKAYSELLFGKRENNGVIYGKNDTLLPRVETGDNLYENINILINILCNISNTIQALSKKHSGGRNNDRI